MHYTQILPKKWNKSDKEFTDKPFKSTWTHLFSLIEKGDLTSADFLFARSVLNPAEIDKRWSSKEEEEQSALFLAHLFASARHGHLCMSIEDPQLLKGAENLPEEIKADYVRQKNGRWYLRRNWEIENHFIQGWHRLQQAPPRHAIFQHILEDKLEALKLEIEQKKAIQNAALGSLSFICGGPGTGKTFTAATLISLLLDCFALTVVAAAPTGKAAANLREKLPSCCEVYTLHSALKRKALYTADVVVIDEGSMVDAATMAKVFSHIPTGARLIMLGDPDQLPPVETGNLFSDLVAHPLSLVTKLKKCLRTDLKEIVEMAATVQRGGGIPSAELPDVKTVVNLVLQKMEIEKDLQPEKLVEHYAHFRALSPLRQGPYGTDALNQLAFKAHCSRCAHPSPPILITENQADLGLFNGDVGVLDLDKEEAFFSGGRCVPKYLLPRYEWAYLLSVHKSQGSEYDEVLLLIPEGAERFGREVLYTAVTRARKKITLYSHQNTLMQMLQKTSPRASGIYEL